MLILYIVLHLSINFNIYIYKSLRLRWTFITFMVSVMFMVVIKFMGDTMGRVDIENCAVIAGLRSSSNARIIAEQLVHCTF